MGKDTISISEILFAINAGPPDNIDPEAAKRGIKAHKDISGKIIGGDIPSSLQRAGLKSPVQKEKLYETDVGNGLNLHARADLVGDGITVDLKPGDLRGRQLLQVAATCAARETKGAGAVYLYKHDITYLIKDGGECARPEIEQLAHDARRLLDINSTLENNRRSLSYTEKFELGKESAKLGKKLRDTSLMATRKIQKQLVEIR